PYGAARVRAAPSCRGHLGGDRQGGRCLQGAGVPVLPHHGGAAPVGPGAGDVGAAGGTGPTQGHATAGTGPGGAGHLHRLRRLLCTRIPRVVEGRLDGGNRGYGIGDRTGSAPGPRARPGPFGDRGPLVHTASDPSLLGVGGGDRRDVLAARAGHGTGRAGRLVGGSARGHGDLVGSFAGGTGPARPTWGVTSTGLRSPRLARGAVAWILRP